MDPSAGDGAILDFIKEKYPRAKLRAVEINPRHIETLRNKGYEPIQMDFLEYQTEELVDLIVMNPPFTQDLEHIRHAYELLKPNGTLISIASAGIKFRTEARYEGWKRFSAGKGLEMMDLPRHAFQRSGTPVDTVLLTLSQFDRTHRYHYYPDSGIVEIENVEDEDYGITTAVVETGRFLSGGNTFPCGSGADIRLTPEMRQTVYRVMGIEESERKAG